MSTLDEHLRRAAQEVDAWTPNAPTEARPRALARRQQRVRRALPVAIVLVVVALLVPMVRSSDADRSRVAADGRGTRVDDPSVPTTTTSTAKTMVELVAPTSTTEVEPSTPPRAVSDYPPRATSTTAVPPTTVPDQKEHSRPPDAFVTTRAGGEVQAQQGSYCWREPEPERAGLCADMVYDWESAPAVTVGQGESLLVRWSTEDQPRDVRLTASRAGYEVVQANCDGGNPCRSQLALAPGSYEVAIGSYWTQGSSSHYLRLQVEG